MPKNTKIVMKEEMFCALQVMDIPTPVTATIGQIRTLYEGVNTDPIEDIDPEPACSEANANALCSPLSEAEEEIAMLKQRIEILELRNKIAALDTGQRPANKCQPLQPDLLKQIIPEFEDGTGVNQCIKAIRQSAAMNEWDDNVTLLYASCRLAGAAREWYKGYREKINTLEEFIAGMRKAFPDHRNEAAVHKELSNVITIMTLLWPVSKTTSNNRSILIVWTA